MSDPFVIAAVTETLRALLQREIPELDHELSDLIVTTQPLDLARNDVTNAQLNLFLYHVEASSVGRNQAFISPSIHGRIGRKALTLNLRYLVTAFGRGACIGDLISARILGAAMSIMHNHPILSVDEINLATENTGHKTQIERLRVTFLPAGVDDLSNLWMTFKTPYRLSVVYEATIHLIDNDVLPDVPLPPENAGSFNTEMQLSDFALPALEQAMLRKIAGQIKGQMGVHDEHDLRIQLSGPGVGVLFEGDNDAAKRTAAEALANELGLLLYRVDLSDAISNYIGETEKNFGKLFDAAERGQTILFFDEADALFGNRANVKDSHDRYANIETNFLLQRMESHDGLMIFATKPDPDLDEAFLRRLRFHMKFSYSGASE
jgi:hypothetical protein